MFENKYFLYLIKHGFSLQIVNYSCICILGDKELHRELVLLSHSLPKLVTYYRTIFKKPAAFSKKKTSLQKIDVLLHTQLTKETNAKSTNF